MSYQFRNLEPGATVSENLSTQFPKPPELQPISSTPLRGQQVLSLCLIIGGIILLGVGSWMFYQYQLEASKPPPARILEVSVTDLTQTPTPPPSPTQPKATVGSRPAGATRVSRVTPTAPATVRPTSTATLPANLVPVLIATSRPTVTPVQELISEQSASPSATPPLPTATAALSLADNPLPVEGEAVAPALATPVGAAQGPAVSPPTRIVAESIDLDAQVVEIGWEQVMRNGLPTNVWLVADDAAGWHKNSALPGQGGNIVLSGHHNINGEVFRHTIDLEVGATLTLYAGEQPYSYTVVDKFIVKDKDEPEAVRHENAKWIGPFNEERLTLVTCWPYTNNTHRAIVIAKPAGVAGLANP